jgi:hypothetical protein
MGGAALRASTWRRHERKTDNGETFGWHGGTYVRMVEAGLAGLSAATASAGMVSMPDGNVGLCYTVAVACWLRWPDRSVRP